MRIVTKGKKGTISSADPCPACGVAQADHWRCARCTARGHLLGHSLHPDYCDDCMQNLASGQWQPAEGARAIVAVARAWLAERAAAELAAQLAAEAQRYGWRSAPFGQVRRVSDNEAKGWEVAA